MYVLGAVTGIILMIAIPVVLYFVARALWRGVPTPGHIAGAHYREADRRDFAEAQAAAATDPFSARAPVPPANPDGTCWRGHAVTRDMSTCPQCLAVLTWS